MHHFLPVTFRYMFLITTMIVLGMCAFPVCGSLRRLSACYYAKNISQANHPSTSICLINGASQLQSVSLWGLTITRCHQTGQLRLLQ